jgi:formyltetrahydrofolate hydrolase
MAGKLVLLIHCPDRPGLVASVTSIIRRFHGNIVDLDQHVDAERHQLGLLRQTGVDLVVLARCILIVPPAASRIMPPVPAA